MGIGNTFTDKRFCDSRTLNKKEVYPSCKAKRPLTLTVEAASEQDISKRDGQSSSNKSLCTSLILSAATKSSNQVHTSTDRLQDESGPSIIGLGTGSTGAEYLRMGDRFFR